MRYSMIMPLLLFYPTLAVPAQVSIGISVPGLSIGINQPAYPSMVLVPGYPVYYVPGSPFNYFFYDGMYWVFQNDEWYCSEWYDGPWFLTDPMDVPVFVLRVPVRYYAVPPPYFAGWRRDAPPRWDEHWGHGWAQRRRGWDRWDRGAAPAPAPLPVYQRQYSGNRYPPVNQQQQLHTQNYRYQPQDAAVRARYEQQRAQAAGSPAAPRNPGTPQPPPARPGNPRPPAARPEPPPVRPGNPNPPLAQPQPPPVRPGNPNPPLAQPQPPPARPENPHPPIARPQPPPVRPGNPNPPQFQPHHPAPAEQPREAPHGNPQPRRPNEPGKGPGPG